MKKQLFRRALRQALQRRLHALATRQPAAAHAEQHSDTRGALRLWRWRGQGRANAKREEQP